MREFIKVVILEGGEQCREVGRLPFPYFKPKFVGDMPIKDYAFNAKLRMYEEQQKEMRIFTMAESNKVPMWECNRCANNNYFISPICGLCGEECVWLETMEFRAEVIDKENLIVKIL